MGTHRTALVLLVATLVVWAVVMMGVLERSRADGPMLVAVFPPGTSTTVVMGAVTRAGGRLVRETWWPWAFVAYGSHPTFQDRLRAEGALWVLPGPVFRLTMMGGCGFPVWRWTSTPSS